MKRWTQLLPILLLPLAFAADAGGRWGVRLELPYHLVGYAEQVAWSTSWSEEDPAPLGIVGVEIVVGTEAVLGQQEEMKAITPYFGIAFYRTDVWARFEVASPYRLSSQRLGYTVALSVGGSWE